MYVFKGEFQGLVGEGNCARRVFYFLAFVKQGEHAFDVGEGLTNFPVYDAEEVEGHVELHEEGVDEYQVSQGHAAFVYAQGGLPHHEGDAGGDDGLLAQIEEGEADLAVCGSVGPLLQVFVVASGFVGFVVEVFDGFVVDEAVYGAGIGGGVCFVDPASDHDAPVADKDGKGDVGAQGEQGDQAENGVVFDYEDGEDEADFYEGGQDGVEGVVDEAADGAGAPFYVPGDAACLPFEVKAQGECVQVLKDFQGETPDGLLGDPGKEDFPEFCEHGGGEAQQAVDEYQADGEYEGVGTQTIDNALEYEGDTYGGEFCGDQAEEGGNNPAPILPQVGEQIFQGGD